MNRSRSGSPRSCAVDVALAEPRPRRDPGVEPKAGGDPRGGDDPRAGRNRPGLVVPPADGAGPTVVVLPGPPRELQPMWETARQTDAFRAAVAGATVYERRIVRLFGIPESEIANTLRAAEADGLSLDALEITTCLRRGEIEMATRYEPPAREDYEALIEFIRRATPTRCSRSTARPSTSRWRSARPPRDRRRGIVHGRLDGRAADRRPGLIRVLRRRRGRLFERGQGVAGRRGSALIDRAGAVSTEVAEALADGASSDSTPTSGSGSPASPGPTAAPRRSPLERSASRSAPRRDGNASGSPAARGCPATARHPRALHHRRDAPPAPAAAWRARRPRRCPR